jgi:hypothetical protein
LHESSANMKYRLLGKSGLRVSEAALGTMTLGDELGWGSPKAEAQTVYETYGEAGGNLIDSANLYTGGSSEQFVGEFIKGHRDNVVVSTKYSSAAPGNNPNAAGNHRKSLMQSLEASLNRLQTDYIDLYWVHLWDGITPVEEVMRGLDDIVRRGKVLYVGDIGHSRMVDRPGKHSGGASRLDTVHRVAGRVQPRGAHGRARTDSHVESFEPGGFWPGLPWRKAFCPGSITATVRPTEGG